MDYDDTDMTNDDFEAAMVLATPVTIQFFRCPHCYNSFQWIRGQSVTTNAGCGGSN
jgi:hypothetical protein